MTNDMTRKMEQISWKGNSGKSCGGIILFYFLLAFDGHMLNVSDEDEAR
jgi:hypothetical protein